MEIVLGIDVGTVSISVVAIEKESKKLIKNLYKFHYGDIRDVLKSILKQFENYKIYGIATTGMGKSLIDGVYYDSQISIIRSVKENYKKFGSILVVGGENFGLITFNENGEYQNYRSNSSCAAGTGSFLDQQAKRLNIEDIESLSEVAFKNMVEPPKIATRCAVFAKTDLIHAQQEGYTIDQISDGLCKGLAKNIIDTLFVGDKVSYPTVFVGGVSKNRAVTQDLGELLGGEIISAENGESYGAIGAALNFIDDQKKSNYNKKNIEKIVFKESFKKEYGYQPLKLKLSKYPKFESLKSYNFNSKKFENSTEVEVDIYEKLRKKNYCYMGIDIGSTSTKAALIDPEGKVLAGFYTRTSGDPLKAVQIIFETIESIKNSEKIDFIFKGVGTTGSGRKFIGGIIGADIMLDEITAHARAAYDLDPEVDTIIEIGGQDAKFTTMKNGMVTLSIMNNVCAAGTGSFIEEQAQKLGVPLREYADRAKKVKAPVSSDRCTVFMERDINNYLSKGYSVDEVLASVLHSVRENYLAKVAEEGNIGDKICFQGATAKNEALVAAFEQTLNKPIFVSKFCHLTGALGTALIVLESNFKSTTFRGIDLYKESIPIETEVCTLCNNNCKIKKVNIKGDVVAFGFLCGRDYNTKKYVSNRDKNFEILKERDRTFKTKGFVQKFDTTVAIPSSLYLTSERYLWKKFFNILGIKVVTSENFKNGIKEGKKIAGAEFCAPMSDFHGHVKYLSEKADYIFLPFYTEDRDKKDKDQFRQYCYYTQFAPSLVTGIESLNISERSIMPVIDHRPFSTKIELYKSLKNIFPFGYMGYWKVASAYDTALDYYQNSIETNRKIFEREFLNSKDVGVVLIGRPYNILSNSMNKGIPDIFSLLKIKTFYQDMLPHNEEDIEEIKTVLDAFHWNYPVKMLEATVIAAKTKGLYPVLVTSFKCGPDSFAIEYFKRIMDKYQKPYLILQIDEHDSSVGYETRVEAAIRAFKNHYEKNLDKKIEPLKKYLPINPKIIRGKFEGKTLLFPSWDNLSAPLVEALLKQEGIDARVVDINEKTVQMGLRKNTSQCLPVNIMYQSFIDYIEKHNLDPKKITVWALDAFIPCNIRMYAYYFKTMFESYGKGFEHIEVFSGEVSFSDISMQAALNTYFAYMVSGMLRKVGCKIRPYEVNKGETNKTIEWAMELLYEAFSGKKSRKDAIVEIMAKFKDIKVIKERRPKVAIFGDMYARDNDFINQDLIKTIEDAGGEAVTTPYNEYAKMIVGPYFKRWMRQGFYKFALLSKTIITLTNLLEKEYYEIFNEVLQEPSQLEPVDMEKVLKPFNVTLYHTGESFDNLIKVFTLLKHDPDISLFALTSPAFCCAGIVTEAMISKIESLTGVPVVPLVYDGTGKFQNDKIVPYIKYPRGNKKDEDKVIISKNDFDNFKKGRYKLITIIPYEKKPVKKERVLTQEELTNFFETYDKAGEFIVELKKID